jgi:hypothetical protein
MDEIGQYAIQYATFLLIMLPWVGVAGLMVAALERVIAYVRGPRPPEAELTPAVAPSESKAH